MCPGVDYVAGAAVDTIILRKNLKTKYLAFIFQKDLIRAGS